MHGSYTSKLNKSNKGNNHENAGIAIQEFIAGSSEPVL